MSYVTGTNPITTDLADLNNDGILDVVTSDKNSNQVSVFFGNLDGTFKVRLSLNVGTGPIDAAIYDYNGDGYLDIATGDESSGGISVLIGNGNGTFKAKVSYGTGSGTASIFAADFNKDGALDLYTSDFGSNSLSVLLGSTQSLTTIPSINIKSQSLALSAISTISSIQDRITTELGIIGSHQSRLTSTVSNLSQLSLSYQEASSRITDLDVAEATSALVSQRIKVQGATAILAYAKLAPELALKLIKP